MLRHIAIESRKMSSMPPSGRRGTAGGALLRLRPIISVAVAAMLVLAATPGHGATSAGSNHIQVENAKPGDTRWRLAVDPATRAAPSAIDGYAGEVSVAPGARLHLHVRSSDRYRVEIDRLGWYGGSGGRLIACLPSCSTDRRPLPQPDPAAPDPQTGIVRAGWTVTDTFTVPADAVSGYYMAEMVLTSGPNAGKARWYLFVVLPHDTPPRLLVEVPVNTWQAYNGWGGKSLYGFNSNGGSAAVKVSFDRPLRGDNHPVLEWELQVVRFLERNGYDAGYVTDVDVSRDPALLRETPAGVAESQTAVMGIGHGEYWTKAIRDAFEAARDAGRSLVFMGADMGTWQVRYEDHYRTLVEYRSVQPVVTSS